MLRVKRLHPEHCHAQWNFLAWTVGSGESAAMSIEGISLFGKQCLSDQKGSKHKISPSVKLMFEVGNSLNFQVCLRQTAAPQSSIEARHLACWGYIPQTPLNEDFIFGGAPDGTYFSS